MINPFSRSRKSAFHKTSYSQCGEDLIVKYVFDAVGIANPVYIDIGAHHPFRLNNTALLYESGSRGINVEPDPELFRPFPSERPHDVNLNIGIGIEPGEADFYVMNAPTLNTFSKEAAEKCEKETQYKIRKIVKIKADTYSNLVTRHLHGQPPDFLSVDVEGLDETLIKNINFKHEAPKVICVETITFSERGRGVKQTGIIAFLQSEGYIYYADTNINSIFVLKSLWEK